VARAEQAGADGYIVKPFSAEALSERIARVIGG
jgi:DNA-binding response OmpR family regulator